MWICRWGEPAGCPLGEHIPKCPQQHGQPNHSARTGELHAICDLFFFSLLFSPIFPCFFLSIFFRPRPPSPTTDYVALIKCKSPFSVSYDDARSRKPSLLWLLGPPHLQYAACLTLGAITRISCIMVGRGSDYYATPLLIA